MQLGFVSAVLYNQPLEEVIRVAAATGYDTVEIMCWPIGLPGGRHSGVTHIDVDKLDDAEVDRIHGLLAKHKVTISALGYYPNPLTPNADDRTYIANHIRKVMHGAKRLGLDRVNSFIGRDPSKTIDANWPAVLETWRPLMKEAEDLGLKVGIENCPMLWCDDQWPGGWNIATAPSTWRRLFNDIQSPNLGLNYDPSHLIWQFIDPIPPVYEFKDRIFHVHAKDMRVDRAKLQDVGILQLGWHTAKLPGMGDVDWGKFFGALTDIAYNGPVCVEVEDRAYEDSLEGRHRSLIQSARYLRSFVS